MPSPTSTQSTLCSIPSSSPSLSSIFRPFYTRPRQKLHNSQLCNVHLSLPNRNSQLAKCRLSEGLKAGIKSSSSYFDSLIPPEQAGRALNKLRECLLLGYGKLNENAGHGLANDGRKEVVNTSMVSELDLSTTSVEEEWKMNHVYAVQKQVQPAVLSQVLETELFKNSVLYNWLRSIPMWVFHWKKKTVTFIFGFVIAGVLLMVGAPATPSNPVTWALTEENLIFLEAWRTIDRAYIDKKFNGQSWFRYRENALKNEPMKNREQTYAAIRKMLSTLEDPFTRFLEPEKFKSLRTGTRGAVTGVGLEVGFQSNGAEANLVVIAPVIGGPADRAGIVPTDIIREIDGISTAGLGLYDTAQRLQGPEGTEVKLTMQKKKSGTPIIVTLVREKIKINPVSWRLCEVQQEGTEAKRIGYIRLATFNENAAISIKDAIGKLKKSGATTFILDMRNNSGGLFPAGIDIAKMWLEKGVIVYITDSVGIRDIYEAEGTGTVATEEPLAVLVNKGTASASEILAGALKDNKRAVIVGEPTFGKGKIQSVFELSDGSGMAVTVARYETPAHVDIDKVGITPDRPLPVSAPLDKDEFCRCLTDDSLPCHIPPSTFFLH